MKRGKRLLLGLAVAAAAHTHSEAAPAPGSGAPDPAGLAAPQARNSISGNVFSDSRRPVADIYVELLDDVGMTITRTRTNSVGRYVFYGVPNGRFKIRVLSSGTEYNEQTQDVSLIPFSVGGAGSQNQQVDFYLRVKARASAGPFHAPGTVFAQEVPAAAKKLYEKGVAELRDKREQEGFNSLRQSLEIFPTYYDALDLLGTLYAVRGNMDKSYFEASLILLGKAVEVNPKSFSSSFGLGFSQYHLGLVDQSISNLERAVNIYNKSIDGHLWLGIALRRGGKLERAEAALKQANELSKGRVADVHWHLAQIYDDQKRYAEAANALEQFLKTKPDARDAEKIKQLIVRLREKASKAAK